ncbi:MAG: RNA polymerase factor sigma-54, partial [Cytophagales bacterium]|nr:RNA polymerase factor sigma-54 [Cytophaga sp.]
DFSDFYSEYEEDVPNYKEKIEQDYSSEEDYYSTPVIHSESFHERIKTQINLLLTISEDERTKIHYLIDSLDDDGYLRADMGELAMQYSFTNGIMCEEEELTAALKKIHACDPVGIGARSLQECLLLQLDKERKNDPHYKLTRKILTEHIFELENRNFEKIKRALNIDQEAIKAAIQLISKLSPKPNMVSDSFVHTNQVIPEYIVRTEDEKIYVSLINKNLPELKLNDAVIEMVQKVKPDEDEEEVVINPAKKKQEKSAARFFKNKLLSAKWLIDALKQREESMLKVMKAIAKFQYEFFMTGDYKNLRPMILKNIAELVQLDISTVSRVTSTRYVQTDFGTILLKELFTEALPMENGEIVSNKEIQNVICDLLETENKSEPLTDQQISEMLKNQGYNLARRTVSKYRECLNIPIAKMRRSLA